jgi:hypothetical protein
MKECHQIGGTCRKISQGIISNRWWRRWWKGLLPSRRRRTDRKNPRNEKIGSNDPQEAVD